MLRFPRSRRQLRRIQRRDRRGGFTLMEVLLVLVILVILGSMAVTVFSGTQEKAFKNAARSQVGLFKSAIGMYKFDTKQYPSSLDDLLNKPSDAKMAERWGGPYLDVTTIPLDQWDNPYQFAAPGEKNSESFDVWSMGPDGQSGTEDDIGNWE